MKPRRVAITGLGVAAPNGIGLAAFTDALRQGRSGIRFFPELEALGFACCIGGQPALTEELKQRHFSPLERKHWKANNLLYGILAAEEAWSSAGLSVEREEPDWESGCVFGGGISGVRALSQGMRLIDEGQVKRLGSHTVPQTMPSSISAYLSGRLGLGNWVTTNASACSTGTEAVRLAFEHIQRGGARRMLCGACDTDGPYIWGGFDALRVLTRKHNERPEQGSRPMSATAAGFVPGSGAGALVLEEWETAHRRGAAIYGEVLGGHSLSGGQRQGGSMTAPNPTGVRRCIEGALHSAGVQPREIDAVSGHLTSTMGDPLEIHSWTRALDRRGRDFPYVNALKSLIGHCLSAAGAIECVAAVIQLHEGFLHPSRNCEDLHPEIGALIAPERVVGENHSEGPNIIAKASFGFGDVNSVLIFRRQSDLWTKTPLSKSSRS